MDEVTWAFDSNRFEVGSGGSSFSKVVSTHPWNTPLNLYQKAKEGFLS